MSSYIKIGKNNKEFYMKTDMYFWFYPAQFFFLIGKYFIQSFRINQDTTFCVQECFPKIIPFIIIVEMFCRAGQAINKNMAQAHFMLDISVYKLTLRI